MTRQKTADQFVNDALLKIGYDTSQKDDTRQTPLRWIEAIGEFCQGVPDVEAIVKDGFETTKNPGMVVQSDIPFRMLCEHHLFPAFGKAYIGYIPHKKMIGLSKLARVVDAFGTAWPGTQEIITAQIGNALKDVLECHAVAIVVRGQHTCMEVRGARVPGVVTTTSFITGLFLNAPQAKDEFIKLAGL